MTNPPPLGAATFRKLERKVDGRPARGQARGRAQEAADAIAMTPAEFSIVSPELSRWLGGE
ncbi:MAG: hypothetical protein BGN85_04260 [Alphaproteobacteria bacterium 64-11]|nr:MAG: hypothetical protein BGN85_04260 [Alphaproteobacteria bacterium 64-11]